LDNLVRILPERAKKGPNFETVNCLYFSLRNAHEKLDLSQVLGLNLLKNLFPFDKTKEKRTILQRGKQFFYWQVGPDYIEESLQH
jgi:hypothetical protein